MPHLAAVARLAFAIEVHRRRRFARELRPSVRLRAEQIRHHRIAVPRGIAERPARDRADVLLELADRAAV